MKQNRIFQASAFVVLAGSHTGRFRSPHTSKPKQAPICLWKWSKSKTAASQQNSPGAYGEAYQTKLPLVRQVGARHRMTAWSGCPSSWKSPYH